MALLAWSAFGLSLLAWSSYWPVSRFPTLRWSMWPTWMLFALTLPLALGALVPAILQGSTEYAVLGIIGALLSFGLFVFVFLLTLLIPRKAGRPGVAEPLPDFQVALSDGRRCAPRALADGGPVLIVFFRGFW